MNADKIRNKYLEFFKSKGHTVIPSASLIPDNDPTVLFTTAGMHPLVPYLLGEKHPGGRKLVNAQKCIRTGDIEDVGDNRHLTFFEMLGNWSLGDYFKKEAIEWSWEFMTGKKWLGLEPARIYVSVFMGDENAPCDEESIKIWQEQYKKAGIDAEVCEFNKKIEGNLNYRIFLLPAEDNWWGPTGQTGPCGACTEMFYDTAPEKGALKNKFNEEVDKFRIMEIWNDVFMEYNKVSEGKFEKLIQKNVDTGMGLERVITVLENKSNVFDTEIFKPLIKKIEELSDKKYGEKPENDKSFRIIADHIKAASFIIGDDKGITPGNLGQGYVVRRLIRKAIRHAKILNIKDNKWIENIVFLIIGEYENIYPELKKNIEKILSELRDEELKFKKTLELGLKEFDKIKSEKIITGQTAFNLFQTYGFPIEMIIELAKEKKLEVDLPGFNLELKKHQELSRTASVGMFKGGLADASESTKKLHTAAHLMLAALRQVLGDHVMQKGSNITAERLRFDFSHPEKMTEKQKIEVETIVNNIIAEDLPVICEEMPLEKAKEIGAMGVFDSKYSENVKVYKISNFSSEICGGPHVTHTGILGHFSIKKEESSSAGVRRIKAILE